MPLKNCRLPFAVRRTDPRERASVRKTANGKRLLPMLVLIVAALAALPCSAVTVDRIAAVIDRQVLTVSEVSQMVELRFFPRTTKDDDDYRREVLEALIAQALRYRDVERFGAQDISRDSIESRLQDIQKRFAGQRSVGNR